MRAFLTGDLIAVGVAVVGATRAARLGFSATSPAEICCRNAPNSDPITDRVYRVEFASKINNFAGSRLVLLVTPHRRRKAQLTQILNRSTAGVTVRCVFTADLHAEHLAPAVAVHARGDDDGDRDDAAAAAHLEISRIDPESCLETTQQGCFCRFGGRDCVAFIWQWSCHQICWRPLEQDAGRPDRRGSSAVCPQLRRRGRYLSRRLS